MRSPVHLLSVVILTGASHAALLSDILDARNYSSWMLDSVIASHAGIGSSGAATGQIELGIFQEALRQSMNATDRLSSADTQSNLRQAGSYLQQSVATSGISSFNNVSKDLDQPLDRLSVGRSLIVQQQQAGNSTSLTEVASLRESVEQQPRNDNGGLWYYDNAGNLPAYHNLSYLDGMFSYAPFTALLPSVLPNMSAPTSALDQISTQLDLLYTRCYHNDSGLLVHGYDAAKSHPWADPVTGASPIVWSRSLAWYMVGLVDSLEIAMDLYPQEQRNSMSFYRLLQRYNQISSALIRAVEASGKATGRSALYQVVTQPEVPDNFVESSGTALVAYVLSKGVRTGLLLDKELKQSAACTARKMFADLVDNFVIRNGNGTLSFNGTSSVASLSGDRINYQYYVSRPTELNSLIGTSAFVLAGLSIAGM